jgi:hypothetical protein
MPPEHEEIKVLRTSSPRKIIAAEVKEVWITQNPHRDINDFYKRVDQQKWRAETESLLKDFSTRWNLERSKLPVLAQMDQKIQSSLQPVADIKANGTYTELIERFGDTEVNHINPRARYSLPFEAQSAWKDLLKLTNEQVQRNTTSLATVVKTVTSVAGDEVFRKAKDDALAARDPKPDAVAAQAKQDWEASELKTALAEVESTLADWDELLAENALPDKQALQALADKCDESFLKFAREHTQVYVDGKVAFVKHQLLATMRSLSEKVASQFASRLGNPSFSAAYGLITEVPVSGNYGQVTVRAAALDKLWGAGSEVGFRKEREKFMGDIRTSDKNVAHPKLTAEIANKTKGLDSAFAKWQQAHDAIGSGDPRAISSLYSTTAELALQFKNYKQSVDRALKDNPSSTVQDIRRGYQETLDGFIASITSGILIGQKLLS